MRSRLIAIAIAAALMTLPLRAAPGQSFVYVAATSDPIAAPEVLVIDAATMAVVTRIPLPANTGQRGMAMSPDGRRLYVRSDDSLVVIDTTTHAVVQTTSPFSTTGVSHLAVSNDGATVYASTHRVGEAIGDSLDAVDVSTGTKTALILGRGYDSMTADVAASRTMPRLFVIGLVFRTNTLDEYDTTTASRRSSTPVDGSSAGPLAISPDGARLYFNRRNLADDPNLRDLAVVSTVSKQHLGFFKGGEAQRLHAGVAGKYVYVSLVGSGPSVLRVFDASVLGESALLTTPLEALASNLVASEDESRIFVATASGTTIQDSPEKKIRYVNRVEILDRASGRRLKRIGFSDSIHTASSSASPTSAVPDGVAPMAVTLPGTPRCSYRLSSTFSSWTTAGGTGSVTLTSPCSWVASTDASWIQLQQTSGSSGTTITFTVDAAITAAGRTATVTIAGQSVTVSQSGHGQNPPYGVVDLPASGSILTGSAIITGWTLDDVGVSGVQIWRDAHPSDPAAAIQDGRVFIGNGTFVDGARPDVAAAFPQAPQNTRAGWGYMMLTRGLVWDGKGAFNLYAYATDVEGNFTLIGASTVTVDNGAATKPFGAIDTPSPALTVSGLYGVTGWVLTPNGAATIPASGVQVAVDGVLLPDMPSMSNRSDITAGFPAFNTTGAGRGIVLDTTRYADGLHTIGFLVTDSTGRSDGVGGRFFTIDNSSAKSIGGTFVPTGSLPGTSLWGHTATQFADGRILIAGTQASFPCDPTCTFTRVAAIYDPVTGSFTAVGGSTAGRYFATGTRLPDGRVLIAGGYNLQGNLSSAEIFDPATGTFSATGSLNAARQSHSATLLANGKVLIAGGADGMTMSAEIYDPAAGVFTMTGSMAVFHSDHTATRLPDGRVLVAGGAGSFGNTSSAEIYDPARGTFAPAGNMASRRRGHTATLLDNGNVLIAGGDVSVAGPTLPTASTEMFDPVTGTFSPAASMSAARAYHTATRTPSGRVLIAGGSGAASGDDDLRSAEIYDPSTGRFASIAPLWSGRRMHSASVLPDGSILLSGGALTSTAERFVEGVPPVGSTAVRAPRGRQ
jgi:hypothetical protein